MDICKSDIYFLILLILISYLFYYIKNKEGFQSSTIDEPYLKTLINNIYRADIEAIRNLSIIASQLTLSNSLTIPGTLNMTNTIKLGINDLNKEVNAGEICYGCTYATDALSIAGKGTIDGQKKIKLLDNVTIQGNLEMNNIPIKLGINHIGKDVNAGKICYGCTYATDALSIVGKGTIAGQRKIELLDNVNVNGNLSCNKLTIGNWSISSVNISICNKSANNVLIFEHINTGRKIRMSQDGLMDVNNTATSNGSSVDIKC
jgi:hypothetical protein